MKRFGGPIPPGASNVHRTWPRRDGLLLRLEDDRGNVGHGEASPLPGYSTDTLEGSRAILEGFDWGRLGGVRDPRGIEVALDWTGLAPTAMPAARFAAESALIDLLALRIGVPAERLLGAQPGPPVPLAALVFDEESAVRAVGRGVRTLKLKIGKDLRNERALAAVIRRRFGDRVALRLDANGAYHPSEIPEVVEAFAPLRPEVIEEPVRFTHWASLGKLPFPAAADESLADPAALAQLEGALEAGIIRVLVLKPMLLGGFAACLRLARLARTHGATSYVTHLFDGPVAMAGCAALALASRDLGNSAAGLDPHAGLAAWPRWQVTTLRGPAIHPHTGRGLPLEISP